MRIVLQRVTMAQVSIQSCFHASIGPGFLLLLGIEDGDTAEDIAWLTAKVCSMRVFSDEQGKMNLDIHQLKGDILVVSQFTLYASTRKGNRPSFTRSAQPVKAIPLYEAFIQALDRQLGKPCASGKFGADMQVELLNDGPVTIILDSKNKE